MRAQWNRYWLVAAAILFALLLLLDSAQAQTPPRSVGLGSNPPGSIYYSLASGLANVVSNASLFQMTVQHYTGSSTYLPLIETGELEFGMVNAMCSCRLGPLIASQVPSAAARTSSSGIDANMR